MKADTTKLTVRVPRAHLDAAKAYAREHGVTLTEVIDRYLRALHTARSEPTKEIAAITGLVPSDIDAASEYRDHMVGKHSQ